MKESQGKFKILFLSWMLMLTPLVLLFTFVTLAAHVRIGLGHWPTPMLENYSTAAYHRHEQVFTWIAIFTVYAVIPLWLLPLCFRAFRVSLRTHLIQAAAYAAGWGLIAIYCAVDPGRFVEWFLD